MLPARRRSEMALFIQQQGGTDTETLARRFAISVMTARRDLKILEQQNFLKVTWGGAVPLNFRPHDVPYASKAVAMLEAKKSITAMAVDMIKDDSCILLDAGTTTLELAKRLLDRRLTVITTDLQIALLLAASATVSVHLAGGRVDPVSRACSDVSTVDYLTPVCATQAFIGTNVWDAERGVTTSSAVKMQIKSRMIACAEQSILLADSSKYGTFSPWAVAGLRDFACVLTDSNLPDAAREAAEQSGATLRVAEMPSAGVPRSGNRRREARKAGGKA